MIYREIQPFMAHLMINMSQPNLPAPADSAVEKPLPLPLAVGIMVVILLGGAGLIWKYLYRPAVPPPAIRAISPLPGNPRVAGAPPSARDAVTNQAIKAAIAEADLPDGIHSSRPDIVLVKAGDAYLRIIRQKGEDRNTIGFFSLSEQEWEHGYLSQGVRRLLSQQDFAEELGLTAEQRERLEKLTPAPASKWPQVDRDRLIALYADEKTRPQVVGALGAYAKIRRAADLKVEADRITQIRSILNEKQLAKVNPIPRWPIIPASSPSKPDHGPHGP